LSWCMRVGVKRAHATADSPCARDGELHEGSLYIAIALYFLFILQLGESVQRFYQGV
jgi:hypothetical protein